MALDVDLRANANVRSSHALDCRHFRSLDLLHDLQQHETNVLSLDG